MMKAVCFRIAVMLALTFVPAGASLCLGQGWTQTGAPFTNWSCVASSADGSKLVAAVNGGFIYTSTNSGVGWTQTSAPTNSWTSVASSADGTQLFAAAAYIYRSTNSGANWERTSSGQADWGCVACAADGNRLAATAHGYSVSVSTNSGTTWTSLAPSSVPAFLAIASVASSADGNTLAVVETDDSMPPSTIIVTPASAWVDNELVVLGGKLCTSVALSADANRITAAAINELQPAPTNCGGILYASASSGAGATTNCTPVTNWTSVASSADGNRLVAVAGDGAIYTSTDAGTNWLPASVTNANWSGVASSADGCKLVAVANGGGIYTWQTIPTPSLSITPNGEALLISWMIPSTRFVLQQNSSLNSTNWTDLSAPVALNLTNLQEQVSIPAPTDSTFYRLKGP